MTSVLFATLAFIGVFAIVVFIHELGHFWMARCVGVRVLRFSIGFGPIIWSRIDKYGTQFALAIIPFGGYVKMLDGREQLLAADEKPHAFDQKSVGKRIAVVAAGPLFNFLFAILAYTGLLIVGMPKTVPVIAQVQENSPAWQAGLRVNDELVSIAGTLTQDWQSVYWALLAQAGEQHNIPVVVRQFPHKPLRTYLLPAITLVHANPTNYDPLHAWGITLGLPHVPARVGTIIPDSPADHAGLQTGDRFVAVDGRVIQDGYELVAYIRERPLQSITFKLERAGQYLVKKIMPLAQEQTAGVSVGIIGVELLPAAIPAEFTRIQRVTPLAALYQAVLNTADLSVATVKMVAKMLTGLVGLENLAGPLSLAQGAQQSVSNGWLSFISFLILINVNLGVINLLPVPVLDGGHLLYYVLELVRGKPLTEKVQKIGAVFGLIFVFALLLIGLHNDIVNF